MTDIKLPDPLVPPEVDLEGLGFLPLQHHRVMQSTLFAKSTGDEFKAAFALWCASWTEKPGGTLPDDDEMLEFLSRAKAWKKVKSRALHGWIRCSDGRLHHAILAPLAIAAWERREEYREEKANTDTRQKRWREKVKHLSSLLREAGQTPPQGAKLAELIRLCVLHVDGFVDDEASTDASTEMSTRPSTKRPREMAKRGTGTVGGTGTETVRGTVVVDAADPERSGNGEGTATPAAAAAATTRGTRLAKDWALPKPWGNWALTKYPQWTPDKVRDEALKFRNHWTGKTGKDATKLDWEATWQNWCMSEIAHRDDPKPGRAAAALDGEARHAEIERQVFGDSPHQEVLDAQH